MAQQEGSGSLLAMIVDADTATGLLLTGVGQVDLRKRANFLIVDDSECEGVGRRTQHGRRSRVSGISGETPAALSTAAAQTVAHHFPTLCCRDPASQD